MLKELPPDHDLGHLAAALKFCTRFRTAIDGGAHKGIWTRELAKHFAQVVAFEPVHHRDIGIGTVIPCALGESPGSASMAPGTENTGQYHITDGMDVPVMPIDAFGLQDIDFLKLDVEGYELFACRGAEKTIRKYWPVILIEENGLCQRYGVKPGEAGEYLESLGYVLKQKLNKDYIYARDDSEGRG